MATQRAIWSGTVNFGLVSLGVQLHTAVEDRRVKFHQLNNKTGHRISQKRIDSADGTEVPWEDVISGYEVAPGHYVTLSPDELASLNPEATKTIEVDAFIDGTNLSPLFFEKGYYLSPKKGSDRAYQLLIDAMALTATVAVGHFVMRTNSYMCLLRPEGPHTLALCTLHYADEVVPPDVLAGTAPAVDPSEVNLAVTLINALRADGELAEVLANYADDYRARVLDAINTKAAGIALPTPAPLAEQTPIGDLMAALEASLKAAKEAKSA